MKFKIAIIVIILVLVINIWFFVRLNYLQSYINELSTLPKDYINLNSKAIAGKVLDLRTTTFQSENHKQFIAGIQNYLLMEQEYHKSQENQVNTPLDAPKLVDESSYLFKTNLDRYWGNYR